ncbi:hypothetical protein Emin_1191 [Elusimicrobium minutum Pei191]|uniref:Uncharacterized protein n=1 Tax=Elusimicrobium minutum (strain Pei191) TaxID=445932 RepID=B2KDZ5_ELUMP|nr:hypothetical protein [Elusimicrobium minutum]ACC98741.1 hypothetical protein Emin_1191 [Elusimicrobium minutum Pei191]
MLVYQICAGILTAALVILIIFAIRFLIQAKETATAVELLVLNANEQVERTSKTFELLENIACTLNSTWGRIFGAAIALSKLKRK